MASRYLTIPDIAAELQISRSAAYELSKKLIRFKFGRIVRVPRASFEAFLKRHEIEPSPSNVPTHGAGKSPPSRHKLDCP